MSSSSSSSSDRRRKAPSLNSDDFTAWEMMFQAHVGYAEWKLFQEAEPAIDEREGKLNEHSVGWWRRWWCRDSCFAVL